MVAILSPTAETLNNPTLGQVENAGTSRDRKPNKFQKSPHTRVHYYTHVCDRRNRARHAPAHPRPDLHRSNPKWSGPCRHRRLCRDVCAAGSPRKSTGSSIFIRIPALAFPARRARQQERGSSRANARLCRFCWCSRISTFRQKRSRPVQPRHARDSDRQLQSLPLRRTPPAIALSAFAVKT